MQLDMENDMEVREQENAISVRDVTKVYRLYDKPIDRLKESMSISHKNYHRDFYALSGLSFQVKKGGNRRDHRYKWFRKVYHFKDYHRSADANHRAGGCKRQDFRPFGAGSRF